MEFNMVSGKRLPYWLGLTALVLILLCSHYITGKLVM